MDAYEINRTMTAKREAAENALRNGWIDSATYELRLRQASEWKRKAESGHWEHQAARQEAAQHCA